MSRWLYLTVALLDYTSVLGCGRVTHRHVCHRGSLMYTFTLAARSLGHAL